MKCIVAIDCHNGIGKKNRIPWSSSEDLKRFRIVTERATMIMGSKTFFSLPINKRPLPGKHRKSIVITFNPSDIKFNKYRDTPNLEILTYSTFLSKYDSTEREEMFVIGGAEIIELFRKEINVVYLTRIKGGYTCDRFVNMDEFVQPDSLEYMEECDDHTYYIYNMKNKKMS
jgi:dihydrofolate reductase